MVQSLGFVKIVNGGTPVQIATTRIPCQTITLQAHKDNAGVVFVGLKGLTTATGVQVLGLIPKPANAVTGPFAELTLSVPVLPGSLDPSLIFIDGTSNDQVVARITA